MKNISVANHRKLSNPFYQKVFSRAYDHMKLFLESPKEYLYSYKLSNKKRISIEPYNPKASRIAEKIMTQIKNISKSLPINFIGSSALKIDGQKDIDILVECNYLEFDKYIKQFNNTFGNPTKTRKKFIEWKYKQEGYNIELSLIDSSTREFDQQVITYKLLKYSPKFLEEYRSLKLRLQGFTIREYTQERMKFFNNLYKKYAGKSVYS